MPGSINSLLGMFIPPLIGNPYNGYKHHYYWVDDHPILHGNDESLDQKAHIFKIYSSMIQQVVARWMCDRRINSTAMWEASERGKLEHGQKSMGMFQALMFFCFCFDGTYGSKCPNIWRMTPTNSMMKRTLQ